MRQRARPSQTIQDNLLNVNFFTLKRATLLSCLQIIMMGMLVIFSLSTCRHGTPPPLATTEPPQEGFIDFQYHLTEQNDKDPLSVGRLKIGACSTNNQKQQWEISFNSLLGNHTIKLDFSDKRSAILVDNISFHADILPPLSQSDITKACQAVTASKSEPYLLTQSDQLQRFTDLLSTLAPACDFTTKEENGRFYCTIPTSSSQDSLVRLKKSRKRFCDVGVVTLTFSAGNWHLA